MAEQSLPEIISRKDARAAGRKTYFTGKLCCHGHLAERTMDGACIECHRALNRVYRACNPGRSGKWRKANPEKAAEHDKRKHQKHPEIHKKAMAKYRATHREEIRARGLEAGRKLRADPEANSRRNARTKVRKEEKRILASGRSKPEVCDICGYPGWRIVLDHDHETGAVRGWLCDRCNSWLERLKHNPELVGKMDAYLEKHGRSIPERQTPAMLKKMVKASRSTGESHR